MVTSGFLHADWGHLLFNMISFYSFSTSLEYYLGTVKFLLLYFISLVGGNMLSLFIHQHHGNYRAWVHQARCAELSSRPLPYFLELKLVLFLYPDQSPVGFLESSMPYTQSMESKATWATLVMKRTWVEELSDSWVNG
ncbi:MAG: rhomboid family intramembrane serine protease [Flammeovirgaceae bacterium]|nr:rhomboid family intramembrane serine protease [Flammeovirgaceae bacterium]